MTMPIDIKKLTIQECPNCFGIGCNIVSDSERNKSLENLMCQTCKGTGKIRVEKGEKHE
jgi:hypothetical protein